MLEAFETLGVRGVLHRPAVSNGDAFALTHGAGSNANGPLLVRMAASLAEAGFLVLRYDLPFRIARSKGPPFPAMAARDREAFARAVDALGKLAGGRVFAGGHSYGGRQTAMTAAEHTELASGLLLLSYPLHPPRKPEQLRTSFFPELRHAGAVCPWHGRSVWHGRRAACGDTGDSRAHGLARGGRCGARFEERSAADILARFARWSAILKNNFPGVDHARIPLHDSPRN